LKYIKGVLYRVLSGEPVDIPLRNLAVFGVTRDSGKTTFIESAVAASGLKALTFRTKRGELGFEGARQVPIYFEERGLTHWRALEGLIAATLEEKVQREPGIRGAIIDVCTRPTQAQTLEEIHERVKQRLEDPKIRGFVRDVFSKLDAYLKEVLPQLETIRPRLTNRLELTEPGVYVEDLTGLSDEVQCLLLASVMRKCYEELSGIIVVFPEVWKFLPQDRGSPAKWILEKYVREMGAVDGYLWIDAQDLRGVDKKHLRSIDTRLFGRQPDPHEIKDLLDALPLPRSEKPTPEQIMTLKLGHFYAKLRDKVELVYVRPRWLPEDVAVQVAKGSIAPDGPEVERYKPREEHSSVHSSGQLKVQEDDEELWKEKYEQLQKEYREYQDSIEKEMAQRLLVTDELNRKVETLSQKATELEPFKKLRDTLIDVIGPVRVATPSADAGELEVGVRPTITEFTVRKAKIEKLEASDQDTQGQILLLASNGWFTDGRKNKTIRVELGRKFNNMPNQDTVDKVMSELTGKGIFDRQIVNNSWTYTITPQAKGLIKIEEG
jgi:hypothetical protein